MFSLQPIMKETVADFEAGVRRVWQSLELDDDIEGTKEQVEELRVRLPNAIKIFSSQYNASREARMEAWNILCGPLYAQPISSALMEGGSSPLRFKGDVAHGGEEASGSTNNCGGSSERDVSLLQSLTRMSEKACGVHTDISVTSSSATSATSGLIGKCLARCLSIFSFFLSSTMHREGATTQKDKLWRTAWNILVQCESLRQFMSAQAECLAILCAMVLPTYMSSHGKGPLLKAHAGDDATDSNWRLSCTRAQETLSLCLTFSRKKSCSSRVRSLSLHLAGLICCVYTDSVMASQHGKNVSSCFLNVMEELIEQRDVDQQLAEGLVMGLSFYLHGFPLLDDTPPRLRALWTDFLISGLSLANHTETHNYQLPRALLLFLMRHADSAVLSFNIISHAERFLDVLEKLWCHKNQRVRSSAVPAVSAFTQSLAHHLTPFSFTTEATTNNELLDRLLTRIQLPFTSSSSSSTVHTPSRRELSFALVASGHLARAVHRCCGVEVVAQMGDRLGEYIIAWGSQFHQPVHSEGSMNEGASSNTSSSDSAGAPTNISSEMIYFLGPFTSSLSCFLMELREVSHTLFTAMDMLLRTMLSLLPMDAYFDSLRHIAAQAVSRLLAVLVHRQFSCHFYFIELVCERSIALSYASETDVPGLSSSVANGEGAWEDDDDEEEEEGFSSFAEEEAAEETDVESQYERVKIYGSFWNKILCSPRTMEEDTDSPLDGAIGAELHPHTKTLRRVLLQCMQRMLTDMDLCVSGPAASDTLSHSNPGLGSSPFSGTSKGIKTQAVVNVLSVVLHAKEEELTPSNPLHYRHFLSLVEFYCEISSSLWGFHQSVLQTEKDQASTLEEEEEEMGEEGEKGEESSLTAASSSSPSAVNDSVELLYDFLKVLQTQSQRYPYISGILTMLHSTLLATHGIVEGKIRKDGVSSIRHLCTTIEHLYITCVKRLSILTDDLRYQCSMCVLMLCWWKELVLTDRVSFYAEEKEEVEETSSSLRIPIHYVSQALLHVLEERHNVTSLSDIPLRVLERLQNNCHTAEALVERLLKAKPALTAPLLRPVLSSARLQQFEKLLYLAASHGLHFTIDEAEEEKNETDSHAIITGQMKELCSFHLPVSDAGDEGSAASIAFPFGRLMTRVAHVCLHSIEAAARSTACELYHLMATWVVGSGVQLLRWYEEVFSTVILIAAMTDNALTRDLFEDLLLQSTRWFVYQGATGSLRGPDDKMVDILFLQLKNAQASVRKVATLALLERLHYANRMKRSAPTTSIANAWEACIDVFLTRLHAEFVHLREGLDLTTSASSSPSAIFSSLSCVGLLDAAISSTLSESHWAQHHILDWVETLAASLWHAMTVNDKKESAVLVDGGTDASMVEVFFRCMEKVLSRLGCGGREESRSALPPSEALGERLSLLGETLLRCSQCIPEDKEKEMESISFSACNGTELSPSPSLWEPLMRIYDTLLHKVVSTDADHTKAVLERVVLNLLIGKIKENEEEEKYGPAVQRPLDLSVRMRLFCCLSQHQLLPVHHTLFPHCLKSMLHQVYQAISSMANDTLCFSPLSGVAHHPDPEDHQEALSFLLSFLYFLQTLNSLQVEWRSDGNKVNKITRLQTALHDSLSAYPFSDWSTCLTSLFLSTSSLGVMISYSTQCALSTSLWRYTCRLLVGIETEKMEKSFDSLGHVFEKEFIATLSGRVPDSFATTLLSSSLSVTWSSVGAFSPRTMEDTHLFLLSAAALACEDVQYVVEGDTKGHRNLWQRIFADSGVQDGIRGNRFDAILLHFTQNYFTYNEAVLKELGLIETSCFILFRLGIPLSRMLQSALPSSFSSTLAVQEECTESSDHGFTPVQEEALMLAVLHALDALFSCATVQVPLFLIRQIFEEVESLIILGITVLRGQPCSTSTSMEGETTPPIISLEAALSLGEHCVGLLFSDSVKQEPERGGTTSTWVASKEECFISILAKFFRGVLTVRPAVGTTDSLEEEVLTAKLRLVELLLNDTLIKGKDCVIRSTSMNTLRASLMDVMAGLFQEFWNPTNESRGTLLNRPSRVSFLCKAASIVYRILIVRNTASSSSSTTSSSSIPSEISGRDSMVSACQNLMERICELELPLRWNELVKEKQGNNDEGSLTVSSSLSQYHRVLQCLIVFCVASLTHRPESVRLLLPIFSQDGYPHLKRLEAVWKSCLEACCRRSSPQLLEGPKDASLQFLSSMIDLAWDWQRSSPPLPPSMWLAASRCIIFPCIPLLSAEKKEGFFELQLASLIETASLATFMEDVVAPAPGASPLSPRLSEKDLRTATNAFQLLEIMCDHCTPDALRGRLNAVFLPSHMRPGTGKELIKKLIDICRKAIELDPVASGSLISSAAWRLYHQAAYRCLLVLMIATQTQEMLYVRLLLSAKGAGFWHHLVDLDVSHSFFYDPPPHYGTEGGRPSGHRPERGSENNGHDLLENDLEYLVSPTGWQETGFPSIFSRGGAGTSSFSSRHPSSTSTLPPASTQQKNVLFSSLSRPMHSSSFSFSFRPTFKSQAIKKKKDDEDGTAAKQMPLRQSNVLLDSIWRSAPCEALLRLLDVLIARSKDVALHSPPPPWVLEVLLLLSTANVHMNVKLVMARLISLRSSFFSCFLNHKDFQLSLLKIATESSQKYTGEGSESPLNYNSKDIICMVLRWCDTRDSILNPSCVNVLLPWLMSAVTQLPFTTTSTESRRRMSVDLGILRSACALSGGTLPSTEVLSKILVPGLQNPATSRSTVQVCGVLLSAPTTASRSPLDTTRHTQWPSLAAFGEFEGPTWVFAVYEGLLGVLGTYSSACAAVFSMELKHLGELRTSKANTFSPYEEKLKSLIVEHLLHLLTTSPLATVQSLSLILKDAPDLMTNQAVLMEELLLRFPTLESRSQGLILESLGCIPQLAATRYEWIHAQFSGKWGLSDKANLETLRIPLLRLLTQCIPHLSLENKELMGSSFFSPKAVSFFSEGSAGETDTQWPFMQCCLALGASYPQPPHWMTSLLCRWARQEKHIWVQDAVLKFMDENVVPKELMERLEYMLSDRCLDGKGSGAQVTGGEGWLRHTAVLLLALSRRSPMFTTEGYFFRNPLSSDQVSFAEKDLTQSFRRGMASGTQQRCTPLFAGTGMGTFKRGRTSNFILAPSSQMWKTGSMAPPKTMGKQANRGALLATNTAASSNAVLFTLPPTPLSTQWKGRKEMRTGTLIAPRSNAISFSQSTQRSWNAHLPDATATASATSREVKGSNAQLNVPSNTLHMIRAASAKQHRDQQRSLLPMRRQEKAPVTLYRQYQEGDFPPTQLLSLEALVTPLQALCLFDSTVAAFVCTSVMEEAVSQGMKYSALEASSHTESSSRSAPSSSTAASHFPRKGIFGVNGVQKLTGLSSSMGRFLSTSLLLFPDGGIGGSHPVPYVTLSYLDKGSCTFFLLELWHHFTRLHLFYAQEYPIVLPLPEVEVVVRSLLRCIGYLEGSAVRKGSAEHRLLSTRISEVCQNLLMLLRTPLPRAARDTQDSSSSSMPLTAPAESDARSLMHFERIVWAALYRCYEASGEPRLARETVTHWMPGEVAPLFTRARCLDEEGAYNAAEEEFSRCIPALRWSHLSRGEDAEMSALSLMVTRTHQQEAVHKLLRWDAMHKAFEEDDNESTSVLLKDGCLLAPVVSLLSESTKHLKTAAALRRGRTSATTLFSAGDLLTSTGDHPLRPFERAAALLSFRPPEESIIFGFKSLTSLLSISNALDSSSLHAVHHKERCMSAYAIAVVIDAAEVLRDCMKSAKNTGENHHLNNSKFTARVEALFSSLDSPYWNFLSFHDVWLLDDIFLVHRVLMARLEEEGCFNAREMKRLQDAYKSIHLSRSTHCVNAILDIPQANGTAKTLLAYAAGHCNGTREELQELALRTLFFDIAFQPSSDPLVSRLTRLQSLRERFPPSGNHALLSCDLARAEVELRIHFEQSGSHQQGILEEHHEALSEAEELAYGNIFSQAVEHDMHHSAEALRALDHLLSYQLHRNDNDNNEEDNNNNNNNYNKNNYNNEEPSSSADALWLLYVRMLLHRLQSEGSITFHSSATRYIARLWQALRRPASHTSAWQSTLASLFLSPDGECTGGSIPLFTWAPWVCQILHTYLATRHDILVRLLQQLLHHFPHVAFFPLLVELDALHRLLIQQRSEGEAFDTERSGVSVLASLIEDLSGEERMTSSSSSCNHLAPFRSFARHLYHLHQPEKRMTEWCDRLERALTIYWEKESNSDLLHVTSILREWRNDCCTRSAWQQCERVNHQFAEEAERMCWPYLAALEGGEENIPSASSWSREAWRLAKRKVEEFLNRREISIERGRSKEREVDLSELSLPLLELLQGVRTDEENRGEEALTLPLHPITLLHGARWWWSPHTASSPHHSIKTAASSAMQQTSESITGVSRIVKAMASKQLPKLLRLSTTQRPSYTVLVKGGDNLNQDQRIQDIFQLFNMLALSEKNFCEASRRSEKRSLLLLNTYAVVPVSPVVGFVEYIPDTASLNEWALTSWQRHAREKKTSTQPTGLKVAADDFYSTPFFQSYMERYPNPQAYIKSLMTTTTSHHSDRLPPPDQKEWFRRIVSSVPHTLLMEGLQSMALFVSDWCDIRREFLHSHCAFGVMSHVLGVGDRHLGNFLVSTKDGSLTGIDFEFSFDAAIRNQAVPELVPLRHSPQFQAIQGVLGDAVARSHMQAFLHFLYGHRSFLDALTSSFTDMSFVEEEGMGSLSISSIQHRPQTAARGMERLKLLRMKLHELRDPADTLYYSLSQRRDVKENPALREGLHHLLYPLHQPSLDDAMQEENSSLSIPEYVDKLILLSTDSNLLSRMWIGWTSFL